MDSLTESWANRQADGLIDRAGQTDRQTDSLTELGKPRRSTNKKGDRENLHSETDIRGKRRRNRQTGDRKTDRDREKKYLYYECRQN